MSEEQRRTIKLTLAYDGTDFAGWQIQANARTVQGTVQAALEQISGEPITLTGSGRTDAGVHALGQVASFETAFSHGCDVFYRALNAELPDDITVVATEEAPTGFHALRSARRKRYRYIIHDGNHRDVFARRYVWRWPTRLDDAAMSRAAAALAGTHDFSSFETAGSERESSVRTVYAVDVARPSSDRPHEIQIEVEADGFLYNMVRAIVGTLVEVGRGARPEAWVGETLAARDRSAAGRTAPPQGLLLLWVRYNE
jgi:tRNA pseudouridine38-40 synthase